MAKVNTDDLRSLTVDELGHRVTALRDEAFRMRFRSATETIENPMRFRTIRREIARLLTIVGEKRRQASGDDR